MSEPMSKQPASTAPPVAAQIELDGSDQPTPTAVIPELAPSNPHAAVLDKLAELGRQSPAVQASRNDPFTFLAELSVIEVARLLEHEHPQTIALVATALAPARAAEILHSMPESLRWDVTQRLARIGTATPDVLCEVAASLESRRRSHRTTPASDMSDSAATFPNSMEIEQPERPQASELSAHAGEASAEPAGLAESNDARGIQETLGSPRSRNRGRGAGGEGVCATRDDPSSSPEEKHSVPSITFEDLLKLDRRSLALIWESVEPRTSAAALLDRSETFKTALLNKLPKPVSVAIRQHLRNLGPIRMSEITTHQEAIVDRAREMGRVVSMKHES